MLLGTEQRERINMKGKFQSPERIHAFGNGT